ncbi:pyridoxamine 5'-phosphate oxidase family protein [Marinococcus sp. PL1-022]|uniref:pyridoxamine 5'-phosphate oxidase family protein n=1 Tax=Marinococcus sp. PL1-022 TaxID=3095363 RepID=UPI0029C56444|nr:pyridoxamine 5'-phosphate oxidase family protein [Marinococcus sp. PL1-022]MDX6153813.1 pyridoxamine 5'-phosphate oxidase family protein [Marinococcus sp. PL1-022]
MDKNEAKRHAQDIIDSNKVGVLATIEGNKPHSRYMTFYNDNFTLLTPTSSKTHKAEEIEKNSNVHILLGYDGEGYGDAFVEISGKAVIRHDQETKEKVWTDSVQSWLGSPDNPDYIVLEIQPDSIRLMNSKGDTPEEIDFSS